MENELAEILREMYHCAATGDGVAMIHLFGIRHAEELRGADISIKAVVDRSGIPMSYLTEVNKGINLARFVRER
jgi:hypothetical protein